MLPSARARMWTAIAGSFSLLQCKGWPGLLGVTIRPSGQLRRSATTRASVSVTTLGSNGLATAMPNASAPTR